MTKELSLSRTEIEESLKKALYNNIMATYLLLSRTGGPYNNHIPEVFTKNQVIYIQKENLLLIYSIKTNRYKYLNTSLKY